MPKHPPNALVLYQAKSGAIAFRGDFERETIWGTLNQIADLFGRDKSVISRHIQNIYRSGELERSATVAKIATVQKEGSRTVARDIEFYNLDVVLSVGYRVDSKQATRFRVWATSVLKQHLIEGFTINKHRIAQNYEQFLRAIADVKALLPQGERVAARDVLELMRAFAGTWFSLNAYDTERFPKTGATKKRVALSADELTCTLQAFRSELVSKDQATELFGQERSAGAMAGIVGNVLQAFGNKDVYPTAEEKAAHLLYFTVKNHPFVDGNKRSGAFAFIWFLRRAGLLRATLTPEALTALTLLVAESNPRDKDKMIGLVLLLLQ